MARLAPKTPEAMQAAKPQEDTLLDLKTCQKQRSLMLKRPKKQKQGGEWGRDIKNKKQNQKYPFYKDKLKNQ